MIRNFFAISILLALSNCSSKEKSNGTSNLTTDQTTADDKDILNAIQAVPQGAETVGLLTFAENVVSGVEIKNIRWSSQISSENPGADCELREAKPGTFTCLKNAVALTIQERKLASGRLGIDWIKMVGKGKKTRDRWGNELKAAGFKVLPGAGSKTAKQQTWVFEGGGGSRATFVFTPQGEKISIQIEPQNK